jgi:hypothetical protein
MTFAPVYPHDPIAQIAPDTFMVRGSVRMNPVIRITRNMAVVRQDGDLTLINPIRMDGAGLAALDALGTVRHVLRLGPLHGLDDPFYMARYRPAFWCQPGGRTYPEPKIDHALGEDTALPFFVASRWSW